MQLNGVLISVRNVKKYYRVSSILSLRRVYIRAVDGVSLDIYERETVGLVGESGSGKSTLGRLLVGLEKPDSGLISFRGTPIHEYIKRKENRRKIQMIFQNPDASLNPRLKVYETLVEALRASGKTGGKDEVAELLHSVGLSEDLMYRYPHQLSGGQRQRVAIARALAVEPEFIVADEVISALDASVKVRIAMLLKRLQRKYGFSMLFISHDLPMTALVSDRIAIMYLGRIVEMGNTREIVEGAAHPYTLHLLTSVPSLYLNINGRPKIKLIGDIPNPIEVPKGCRLYSRCPLRRRVCNELEPNEVRLNNTHVVFCHFPLIPPYNGRYSRSSVEVMSSEPK